MNQATEQRTRPIAFLVISSITIGAVALSPLGCEKKTANKGFGTGAQNNTEVARDDTPEVEAPSDRDEAPDSKPEERTSSRRSQRDVLVGLDLDDSVEFPPINAPSTRDIAESVAALAGAIALGDSQTLHPMLDQPSQVILDQLVESDHWREATGSITKVRVCTLEEDGQTIRIGLGVESLAGAYLLGWEGERIGSGWLYAGIALETPTGADTAAQLDGSSLIARLVPEPGEIIDESFDPTINDPRREQTNRKRGRRGGGGGRRGL